MKLRIYHLDSLRAFAILMMLQGHFIYSMLEVSSRESDHLLIQIWKYGRGTTAPLFFTITGLVVTFLLLQSKNPEKRIKKTFKRGRLLFFWGYLLQFKLIFFYWGIIPKGFWAVNVLQCIGICLIVLVSLYRIFYKFSKQLLIWILLFVGITIFIFEPITAHFKLPIDNLFVNAYITKEDGSVFTLLPWIGYTFIGAFLGLIYKALYKPNRRLLLAAIFLLLGYSLIFHSTSFFQFIYKSTSIELFQKITWNNYLFIRLGDVFAISGIFLLLENWLKNAKFFNKIGRSTLTVYIIHFFLLYGSVFGLGIANFLKNDLPPFAAILGVIAFMISTVLLALNMERWKYFRWAKWSLRRLIRKSKNRFQQVLTKQS